MKGEKGVTGSDQETCLSPEALSAVSLEVACSNSGLRFSDSLYNVYMENGRAGGTTG